MSTFNVSIIYDGSDVLSSSSICSIATNGTTVYGSFDTENLAIITGIGSTDRIILGYAMRGIAIANNFLFILDFDNSELKVYDVNNILIPITSVSTLSHPHGLCTDWDGNSSVFNLYFTHEDGEDRIGYCSFDGSNFGTVSYISTIIGGFTNTRVDIAFRKYGSYKYLYVTTQDESIIQINITTILSPTLSQISVFLLGTGISVSWGICSNPISNIFYVGELMQNAIYAFTYTPDITTGLISSFTSVIPIINESTTTNVTNGNSSTSEYVAALGLGYNITSHGINLFIATNDKYIVKLYPIGGNGVGGDPHIMPLIGNLYNLDNSVKYVRLFENCVGNIKIKIIGETWILPQEELEKFKSRPNVYNTLLEYTFIKNLFFYCGDEKLSINMDSMEIIGENKENKYIKFEKTKHIDQMYSIRRKRNITNTIKNNVLQRIVKIYGGDTIVTLTLQCDVSLNDRNSITIVLEGNHALTKENFIGALIFESNDNAIESFCI